MSSFIGSQEERWTLARAVDGLAESARAAGRPGLFWVAGFLYPMIGFGLGALGRLSEARGPALPEMSAELVSPVPLMGLSVEELALGGVLLIFLFSRLHVGLARISSPLIWARAVELHGGARLRHIWRGGGGLALSAFGMWVMLFLMAIAALGLIYVVAAPLLGMPSRGDFDVVFLVLLTPVAALMVLYATSISVIHQLALHSLAHNRRGMVSALRHAWSIARRDPWATARSIAVDVVLVVALTAVTLAIGTVASGENPLFWLCVLPIYLYTSVTRAGYWARAYRALGGLSPEDGVPGLTQPAAGSVEEPGHASEAGEQGAEGA